MKRLIVFIWIAISFTSCRLEEDIKERVGPLHIVATTGIIADCLNNIVGDKCEITSLMGPGTDPHIYKPTPGDVELLEEADVIVANGLHLEGKMSEMLEKFGQEKPVLLVSDGIDEGDIIKSADMADAHDPHIWFDTEIWMDGFENIADELGKIDTVSAAYYISNFEAYKKEVNELDDWIKQKLSGLSEESRVLVTSHDAFSYFGKRYKMEVRGIQGISTLSEVGLKDIAEMVDFVIERGLKSIFVETSTSDKTAQSIVDGCSDKNYELTLAGPLYSDALGEPDTEAGTYIGMIKANVTSIINGLK